MSGIAIFEHTYSRLPPRFFCHVEPTPVVRPSVIRVNDDLAAQLGFDPEELRSERGAQWLAGNEAMPGAQPIATAYAGHQFGGFNSKLGDGRAILLGEVIDNRGGRFDVQLKGAGQTPYSRRGDGRSPMGPVLREYIVSEAMASLGVPSTRALAAVATGESVHRDEVLPGAILARVAQSHIRIGTFEYFAARHDHEAVGALGAIALWSKSRSYPQHSGA